MNYEEFEEILNKTIQNANKLVEVGCAEFVILDTLKALQAQPNKEQIINLYNKFKNINPTYYNELLESAYRYNSSLLLIELLSDISTYLATAAKAYGERS